MTDVTRTISGWATVEATRDNCASRGAALRPFGGLVLGRTGLHVSGVGFGCYRVHDSVAAQAEALRLALRSGVNLIDTSANYGDGGAEVLVGRVLRELIDAGEITREQVVVVTKGGYIQGLNMRVALEREAAGKPFPEVVKISRDCWHSISPEFLEDQITRSLARMGLECADVYLLHNPEYYLELEERRGTLREIAHAEYERRIGAAFEHLEREVARGRIASYGVSSNAFPNAADDYEFTSLARCIELAGVENIRSGTSGFKVIQCPANLFERGAWSEKNQRGPGAEAFGISEGTPLELAWAAGLGVLFNRPLNAFHAQRLLRLADPPDPTSRRSDVDMHIQALESFEDRLRRDAAKAGHHDDARPFHVASVAAAHWPSAVTARDMEAHIERELIPFARQAAGAMDRLVKSGAESSGQAEAYVTAMNALIGAMAAAAEAASMPEMAWAHQALRGIGPVSLADAPLSRKAVWTLRSLGGPAVVLVGMRRMEYVRDTLAAAMIEPGHLSGEALAQMARELDKA